MIVRVNVVLKGTLVVDSFGRFDNLCGSHLQSRSELYHDTHSRGQQQCKSLGIKESFYIRKEFNSQRIGLNNQHGRLFIVLGQQHGGNDVM